MDIEASRSIDNREITREQVIECLKGHLVSWTDDGIGEVAGVYMARINAPYPWARTSYEQRLAGLFIRYWEMDKELDVYLTETPGYKDLRRHTY